MIHCVTKHGDDMLCRYNRCSGFDRLSMTLECNQFVTHKYV